MTGTLDVVNGSMAHRKSSKRSGGLGCNGRYSRRYWDGIVFLESCHANCSDEYASVGVISSTLSWVSIGFLVSNADPFYLGGKDLSCTSSAFLDDGTGESLEGSSLTLGEACAVTYADGYTAARDTKTTLTCVFEPELQSLSLVGSNHSGRRASRYFRTLTSHDSPNTVFGESHTASCLDGNAEISGVSTCGSQGALVRDLTFPCPTCRGSSIVDACMVFGSEEYRPFQTTPQL